MDFTINSDFEKLIPPLSQDERAGLEALILADGIQSPLIIARYPNADGKKVLHLADGHNRYRIAQKHGLIYKTIIQDFDSEDDVIIWMVDNQKGRRNLTDFVKLELAEVKAGVLRKKGKDKQRESGMIYGEGHSKQEVLSIIDKTSNDQPHNTRNEIAADLGWSTGKVAMAQKVMNTAPEEVKEQLRTGEVSINQAYKQAKQEYREAREVQRAEQLQKKTEGTTVPIDQLERIAKLENGETVILNMNRDHHLLKYATDNGLYVRCDRFSDWGNPFVMGVDGDRDEVCNLFDENYLPFKRGLLAKISDLKGKALGCHCYPERCHCETLKAYANGAAN